MAYELTVFSEQHNYWLGTDPVSQRHVLGIPVSNPMVDYIETYWLEDQQFATFADDEDLANEFADACRRREHDDLTYPHARPVSRNSEIGPQHNPSPPTPT